MPLDCIRVVCAGAQHQFTRRKQDAVCVQGGDYKRPKPTTTPCTCTAADVECDYGFVAGANGTCAQLPRVRVPGTPLDLPFILLLFLRRYSCCAGMRLCHILSPPFACAYPSGLHVWTCGTSPSMANIYSLLVVSMGAKFLPGCAHSISLLLLVELFSQCACCLCTVYPAGEAVHLPLYRQGWLLRQQHRQAAGAW
jgi:hypothetical protein